MGGVNVDSGGKGGAEAARLGDQHDPDDRPPDGDHLVPPHHGRLDPHGTHERGRAGAGAAPAYRADERAAREAAPRRDAPQDKFVLVWKQSGTVISTVDVPRKDVVTVEGHDAASSASRISRPRSRASGSQGPAQERHRTRKLDQAILHTDNKTSSGPSSGSSTRSTRSTVRYKKGSKVESLPAFNMTFAVN